MKYIEKLNTTCELTEQIVAQKAMWAIVLELFRHIGLATDFLEGGNFKHMATSFHRAFAGNTEFMRRTAFKNDVAFKNFELVMSGDHGFIKDFNSTFTKETQRTFYLSVVTLLSCFNHDRREALLNFLHVFATEPNNTLFACYPGNAEYLLHLLTNPELTTERSTEHD